MCTNKYGSDNKKFLEGNSLATQYNYAIGFLLIHKQRPIACEQYLIKTSLDAGDGYYGNIHYRSYYDFFQRSGL